MTEHSIEELKRQHDAAYSKMVEAKNAELMARERLHKARSDSTGLIGKLAISTRRTILVANVVFYGKEPGRVEGFILNKNGKPGYRVGSVYLSDNPTFEDYRP